MRSLPLVDVALVCFGWLLCRLSDRTQGWLDRHFRREFEGWEDRQPEEPRLRLVRPPYDWASEDKGRAS